MLLFRHAIPKTKILTSWWTLPQAELKSTQTPSLKNDGALIFSKGKEQLNFVELHTQSQQILSDDKISWDFLKILSLDI
jgi:hypothetical protein